MNTDHDRLRNPERPVAALHPICRLDDGLDGCLDDSAARQRHRHAISDLCLRMFCSPKAMPRARCDAVAAAKRRPPQTFPFCRPYPLPSGRAIDVLARDCDLHQPTRFHRDWSDLELSQPLDRIVAVFFRGTLAAPHRYTGFQVGAHESVRVATTGSR